MARGIDPDLYEPCRDLFADFYPTKTMFGKPYEHVLTLEPMPEDIAAIEQGGEPNMMPLCMLHYYGVPSYLIETYCGGNDMWLHFQVTLFLLARHAGVPWSDKDLLRAVRRASAAMEPCISDLDAGFQ